METYKSFIFYFGEKIIIPGGLYTDDPMRVIRTMAREGATEVTIYDEHDRVAYHWDSTANVIEHRTYQDWEM